MFNIRIGFSVFGLISVVLIMIPNIIWGIRPPANDVLSQNAGTSWLDIAENIGRFAMMALLVGAVSKTETEFNKTFLICAVVCLAVYYAMWVMYYLGYTQLPVLIGLAFVPALYFLSVSMWIGNFVSIIPNIIFVVCHLIITFKNYR